MTCLVLGLLLLLEVAAEAPQWKRMADGPSARSQAVAGVYGNKVLLFGGSSQQTHPPLDLWEFDMAQNSWIQPPIDEPNNAAACCCAATGTFNDSLFMVGCVSDNSRSDSSVLWSVNYNTYGWKKDYIQNPPRWDMRATNGILVGSTFYFTNFQNPMQSISMWSFNISSLIWSQMNITGTEILDPNYMGGASLVADLDGKNLYLYGGAFYSNGNFPKFTGNQFRFSLENYRWYLLSPGPPSSSQTGTLKIDGTILYFGGQNGSTTGDNELWVSDPVKGSFSITPTQGPIPVCRTSQIQLPLYETNDLFVFGGSNTDGCGGGLVYHLNDTWTITMANPLNFDKSYLQCAPMGYAGDNITCIIFANDDAGFPTGAPSWASRFALSSDPSILFSSIQYIKAGQFQFDLSSTKANQKQISVTYQTTPIKGSSTTILPLPEIDPNQTYLTCPKIITVGDFSNCSIVSHDTYGNPNGDKSNVANFSGFFRDVDPQKDNIPPRFQFDGIFYASVRPVTSGPKEIGILYNNRTIAGDNPALVKAVVNGCQDRFAELVNGTCLCIQQYTKFNDAVCGPCAVAQSKPFVGDGPCVCQTGFYDLATTNSNLVQCIDIFGGTKFPHSVQTFPDNNCTQCPPCLLCNSSNLTTSVIKQGFWFGKNVSEIYLCQNLQNCRGNSQTGSLYGELNGTCVEGYTGPLCAVCDKGYAGYGSECDLCGSPVTSWLLAALQVSIALAVLIFLIVTANQPSSTLLANYGKILLSHVQLIALIGTFRFALPSILTQILSYLGISLGTAGGTHAFSCLFDYNFVSLTIILYISMGFFIPGLIYWIFAIPYKDGETSYLVYEGLTDEINQVDKREEPQKPELFRRLLLGYSTTCLIVIFLVYPTFAVQVFTILSPCVEVDGDLLMLEDLSVSCHSENFHLIKKATWFYGLPFVIGTVAIWSFILFWNRKRLHHDDVQERFYFFYSTYKPKYYFWEIVITLRKVGIAVISALMSTTPNLQLYTGIAFINSFLIIHLQSYPMKEATENHLETGSLLTALFTLVFSLYSIDEPNMATSYVILVVNLLFGLIVGFFILKEGITLVKETWEKIVLACDECMEKIYDCLGDNDNVREILD